jgi:hypothetical protein
VTEEGLSRGKKRHPTWRPDEQWSSDLVLESTDLPADRWLGDAEPNGRATHISLLGDGDEVANLSEAHPPIVAYRSRVGKPGPDRNGIGRV